MNIDILGISELKWTGKGEFNSDIHYIYYCGQESRRRNGVTIIVNKSLKCSTWMQSQKQQNDLCLFPRQTIQYHSNPSLYPSKTTRISVHFQGKPFSITVIQVYTPTSNAEEAEVEWFYEDLQNLFPMTQY